MASTEELTFGSLLRRLRRDAELTQEALAERAGLSVRGIGYLERGEGEAPYQATVVQLADALALSPTDRAALLRASQRPGPRSLRLPAILPIPPTPLIGREREVTELEALLARSEVRLLTLIGPGGVGKTRLGLEVASRLQGRFPDGVVVVALASLRDPSLVMPTIAQTLGLRETGERPVSESLVASLREKQLLLLLDNLEHLLTSAPLLVQVLAACPQLRMMVTSRAALGVRGEHEYPVHPLSTPNPRYAPPVHALLSYPAIELFVQRIMAVRPTFQLGDANAMTIAEICYRLDGLPLALELAAARIKLFPPHALLQRLDRRLTLLTGGAADQPLRHQTLRNTLDWSYSLISETEQTLLARLSVFAGGCTFGAAEAVCNPDGAMDLMEGLASLVDKSLVRQEGEQESRFLLLETVREYGEEKLQQRGEEEPIKAGHARYFLRLAEKAEEEMDGPNQAEWHGRLDLEVDNVREALTWLLERGQIEEELRLTIGLAEFWHAHGYWSEGIRWLEAGLTHSGGVAPEVCVRALNRAGELLVSRTENEQAIETLEQALALARELDDKVESAFALHYLGWAKYHRGEVAEAIERVEESLRISREIGDRQGIPVALTSLGGFAAETGDFAVAEVRHREALGLVRENGAQASVAICLYNLGYSVMEQGRYGDARAFLEESEAVFRELGMTGWLHGVLDSLGLVANGQGELDRAEGLFAEALTLSQDIGDRRALLCILDHMAGLAVEQQEPERAARLAGAEAAGREVTGMPNPPVDQERLERAIRRAREELGEEAFRQSWQAGRTMSLDAAVEYALSVHRPP